MSKVIIFTRHDGGLTVINPAPEMFDPNSRTIRFMEADGKVFPSIVKIFEIEEARKAAAKAPTALSPGAPFAHLYSETPAEADATDPSVYEIDRTKHPSFDQAAFEQEVLAHIIQRNMPLGKGFRIVDANSVPADRYFRNAWIDDEQRIKINMTKARDIQRDLMREARAKLFPVLDGQYAAASGKGDTKAAASIEASRQRLRDVTQDPAIEAARIPEELKAVWPDFLGSQPT